MSGCRSPTNEAGRRGPRWTSPPGRGRGTRPGETRRATTGCSARGSARATRESWLDRNAAGEPITAGSVRAPAIVAEAASARRRWLPSATSTGSAAITAHCLVARARPSRPERQDRALLGGGDHRPDGEARGEELLGVAELDRRGHEGVEDEDGDDGRLSGEAGAPRPRDVGEPDAEQGEGRDARERPPPVDRDLAGRAPEIGEAGERQADEERERAHRRPGGRERMEVAVEEGRNGRSAVAG